MSMEEIKKLRSVIDQALSEMNLERMSFALLPGDDNTPDSLTLVLKIDKKAFMTTDQIAVDSEFQNLISNIAISDKNEQLNSLIQDWLSDDDDETPTSE